MKPVCKCGKRATYIMNPPFKPEEFPMKYLTAVHLCKDCAQDLYLWLNNVAEINEKEEWRKLNDRRL